MAMGVAYASKKKRRRKPSRCRPLKKGAGVRKRKAWRKRCRPKAKPRPKPRSTAPKRPKPTARPPKPAPRQPVPPPPRTSDPVVVPPPRVESPIAVYQGTFGRAQAERLLWRAGFGPSPGHAEALAAMGLAGAVESLVAPAGPETFTGAEPKVGGAALAPEDAWGHDHLFWLDRMVRTSQPLRQRMTLIWHDWFATSNDGVGSQRLMLEQNELFRRSFLGSFLDLTRDVTVGGAMLVWLNGVDNHRWGINENYARELMELFTLGADRGAYTEADVRELARCLSGWRGDWSSELAWHNFRFDRNRWDAGQKTVFGKTGAYGWEEAYRMCVYHAMHPSFFVEKLWSYFIPTPPSEADRKSLEASYVNGGYKVEPIVRAILLHPSLYEGPRMVKPPVVFAAGLLRALRRPIDRGDWVWVLDQAGQRLFYPPDVSGWDDERWLDTSTLRGRWQVVQYALGDRYIGWGDPMNAYDPTETPDQAVTKALEFWGNPAITNEGRASLVAFAGSCLPAQMADWAKKQWRAQRQNALRQLIASLPDAQTS